MSRVTTAPTSDDNLNFMRRVYRLVELCDFENYEFAINEGHGGVYVYARYPEADIYTGNVEEQHTRKWLLSPQMTDSEVVQTVFKLCATSMEHRLREHFLYKGKRVYGPHFDVEDLVKLCESREAAGGRQI